MADSMSKLIKRIRNYTYKKEDLVEPASAIQHTGESLVLNGEPIRATHTAVRHLCIHAKIPADFFMNRLLPEEQIPIFNRMFSALDTEFMFRLSNKTLYGVVSPKYSIMDNIVLVDILKAADEMGLGLKPVKSVLNPDHTKIRLIYEHARVGELVPMLELTNSENGMGSLVLWAGIYRYVCSNGLLIPVTTTQSRWIHYGADTIDIPDFHAVLDESVRYVHMLDQARTDYLSAEGKMSLIQDVSSKFSGRVADAVTSAANHEYHGAPTRFHFVNAVTKAAQTFEPAQQTCMESYAHTLLLKAS